MAYICLCMIFLLPAKIPVIIHELIATEVWKQNVFTQFITLNLEPKVAFPVYMVVGVLHICYLYMYL